MAKQRKNSGLRNPQIDPQVFGQDNEYVILDFETTGQNKQAALDPESGSIIQASAITYRGFGKDRQEVSRRNWRVYPDEENIPYLDTNISGIKSSDYQEHGADYEKGGFVYQQELAKQLNEYLGSKMIVAHNAPFERSWMDQMGVAQNNPMLDTLDLARTHLIRRGQEARKGFSLDTLRKTLNLPGAGGQAHTAEEDVETTAQLLDALHGRAVESARAGGLKAYTPAMAKANATNASIGFLSNIRAITPTVKAPPAQKALKNQDQTPAQQGANIVQPVSPPSAAQITGISLRAKGTDGGGTGRKFPNLWKEGPPPSGPGFFAGGTGRFDPPPPPPVGPPSRPERRPSRIGQSTMSAVEIEKALRSGWSGLKKRGYEGMADYASDRYTTFFSDAEGNITNQPAQAAMYKSGAVQGSYGMHIRRDDFPENRGLFLQVKGSFGTQQREGERALSVMTEGGAEYSIGSLLRVYASGSEKEGNLSVRTERLTPEEHLAMLIENSFRYARDEGWRKGGYQRHTSEIFQELLTEGNMQREKDVQMRTPGGALLITPNEAQINDRIRRRVASDMSIAMNLEGDTREEDVFKRLNQMFENGEIEGTSNQIRAWRVGKEPRRIQTKSGQMVDVRDSYTARAIRYGGDVTPEGDVWMNRAYANPAKAIYATNKLGPAGGSMEETTPYTATQYQGRMFIRPVEAKPIPGRISAGSRLPLRVRPNISYGSEAEGSFINDVSTGLGLFVASKPGSGSTLVSSSRFMGARQNRGEEGIEGFYTMNPVQEKLDFIKDLRDLTKMVETTNAKGEKITAPLLNILQTGTGRKFAPGEVTPLFEFQKLNEEGGRETTPRMYTHDSSGYAVMGSAINLPAYMTPEGAPVYGLTGESDQGDNIPTTELAAQLEAFLAENNMQGVKVTRNAKEGPTLTFDTAVQTGVSAKGGMWMGKAGEAMGPEDMRVSFAEPETGRMVNNTYAREIAKQFPGGIPVTDITAEGKQLVGALMSGFQIMPKEQQAEMLRRIPNTEQAIEYLQNTETPNMRQLSRIWSKSAGAKRALPPEEMFRRLMETFTNANEEQNVANLKNFGIGRVAGWTSMGPASEGTRYIYQTEARQYIAQQMADRLIAGPGENAPAPAPLSGDWANEDYQKMVLGENVFNQLRGPDQNSGSIRLAQAAQTVDTLMNQQMRFVRREGGQGENVYDYQQYVEGMTMPYSKNARPEFAGGLRLGYETIFSAMSKFPQAALALGLAPSQGPFGGDLASASPADKAWMGITSSLLYRNAVKQGVKMPNAQNVIDINEDMAAELLSQIPVDDTAMSVEKYSGALQEAWRRQTENRYISERGYTPEQAAQEAAKLNVSPNMLLRFRANGIDEFLPTPEAMKEADFPTVSGQSQANWLVQYQNVSRKLMEATAGGGGATEDSTEAIDKFYQRVQGSVMTRKSSEQRTLYGRTPNVALSGRYQPMNVLGLNEMYLGRDQASRVAKMSGFKSLKQFYSYVDKEMGGRVPGMWFRQPTLGRESGMAASYMVTPKYLQKQYGLKPSEIPQGASAAGIAFVNPIIATSFAGDFDDDPYGWLMAAIGQGDKDNRTLRDLSKEDPGLAKELAMNPGENFQTMRSYLNLMFGQQTEHYDVLRSEMEGLFGKKEDVANPSTQFGRSIKSLKEIGYQKGSYLTQGVEKKAMNDRIKGTSYNAMRALEAFFVAGSAQREGIGEAADYFGKASLLYPNQPDVNRAITSLASIYQPGLDLEVPLTKGLSGIETAFGTSFFSLQRDENGAEVTKFGFRPSDAMRVKDQKLQRAGFVSTWNSSQGAEGGVLSRNTLQAMAGWFTQEPNLSNEALALAFSSDVGGLQDIQKQLSKIKHPGAEANSGQLEKYAQSRAKVLRNMISSGAINENATAYRAMLARAATSAKRKSPDEYKRMQVAYGGQMMTLPELMERPEMKAGQTFFDIMTGHIPELIDQADLANFKPGQYFLADLARAGLNELSSSVGSAPETIYKTLADWTREGPDPLRIEEMQTALYDAKEGAPFKIRASQAYAVANPQDAQLQNYAPEAMRDWGNTGLFGAVGQALGIDMERYAYSGSAATERGTKDEKAIFDALVAEPETANRYGKLFLGDSKKNRLSTMVNTPIGRAEFTGHQDIIGYRSVTNDQGEVTGHRLVLGDIKTTNIDKAFEEIRLQNPMLSDEQVQQMAIQQSARKIQENPQYQTQLGLYGHGFQGPLSDVYSALQTAGGDQNNANFRKAFTRAERIMVGRGMDQMTARQVVQDYIGAQQGGPSFGMEAGLFGAYYRTIEGREQLVGRNSEMMPVSMEDKGQDWLQRLAMQGISAIRSGIPDFMNVARKLTTVGSKEEFQERTNQRVAKKPSPSGATRFFGGSKIKGSYALSNEAWLPDVQGNFADLETLIPEVTKAEDLMLGSNIDMGRVFGQSLQQSAINSNGGVAPTPAAPPPSGNIPPSGGVPPAGSGGNGGGNGNIPITPMAVPAGSNGGGGNRNGGFSGGMDPEAWAAAVRNLMTIVVNPAKIEFGKHLTQEQLGIAANAGIMAMHRLNTPSPTDNKTRIQQLAERTAMGLFGENTQAVPMGDRLDLLRGASLSDLGNMLQSAIANSGSNPESKEALLGLLKKLPTRELLGLSKSFDLMTATQSAFNGPLLTPENEETYGKLNATLADPMLANMAGLGRGIEELMRGAGLGKRDLERDTPTLRAMLNMDQAAVTRWSGAQRTGEVAGMFGTAFENVMGVSMEDLYSGDPTKNIKRPTDEALRRNRGRIENQMLGLGATREEIDELRANTVASRQKRMAIPDNLRQIGDVFARATEPEDTRKGQRNLLQQSVSIAMQNPQISSLLERIDQGGGQLGTPGELQIEPAIAELQKLPPDVLQTVATEAGYAASNMRAATAPDEIRLGNLGRILRTPAGRGLLKSQRVTAGTPKPFEQRWHTEMASGYQTPEIQNLITSLQGQGIDLSDQGSITGDVAAKAIGNMPIMEMDKVRDWARYAVRGNSFNMTGAERQMFNLGGAILSPQGQNAFQMRRVEGDLNKGLTNITSQMIQDATGGLKGLDIGGRKYNSFQELYGVMREGKLSKEEIQKAFSSTDSIVQNVATARSMGLNAPQQRIAGPEFEAMMKLSQGMSVDSTTKAKAYSAIPTEELKKDFAELAKATSELNSAERNLFSLRQKSTAGIKELEKAEISVDKARVEEKLQTTRMGEKDLRSRLAQRGITDLETASAKGAVDEWQDLLKKQDQIKDLETRKEFAGTRTPVNIGAFTRSIFGGFGLQYLARSFQMGLPAMEEGAQETSAFRQRMSLDRLQTMGVSAPIYQRTDQLVANRRIGGGSMVRMMNQYQAATAGTPIADLQGAGMTGAGAALSALWVGGTLGENSLLGLTGSSITAAAGPLALGVAGLTAGAIQYSKYADMQNQQVRLANLGGELNRTGFRNPVNAAKFGWEAMGPAFFSGLGAGFEEFGKTRDFFRAERVALGTGLQKAIIEPKAILSNVESFMKGGSQAGQIFKNLSPEQQQQMIQGISTTEAGSAELKYLPAELKASVAQRMASAGLAGESMLINLTKAQMQGRDTDALSTQYYQGTRSGVAKEEDVLRLQEKMALMGIDAFKQLGEGAKVLSSFKYGYDYLQGRAPESQFAIGVTQRLGEVSSGARGYEFQTAMSIYDERRALGMMATAPDLNYYGSQVELTPGQKAEEIRRNAQQTRGARYYQQLLETTEVDPAILRQFSDQAAQTPNVPFAQALMNRNPYAVATAAAAGGIRNPNYYAVDTRMNQQSGRLEVTGLPMFETSMRLGYTPPQDIAQQIWGDNWQNSKVAQAAVNGVDVTTSGGATYNFQGMRGIQAMQMQLNQNAAAASVAAQQKNWQAQWAFTTGVGLNQYANIQNPQTGQSFGFNTGAFNVNLGKYGGSFTSAGGGMWGIEDAQRFLSNRQQEWGFEQQRKQMALQRSQFYENINLNRTQDMMQRGWTQQDWAYQDEVRGMQWQWRKEDYNEEKRFMSGRQRRLAERQMGRETKLHDMEDDQIQRQRGRQQELWKLEDQRFALQKKQFEQNAKLQKEELEASIKFYEERKKLEEEAQKLQRAQWVENMNNQKAAMDAQAEATMKSLEIQKDMFVLQTKMEDQQAKVGQAAQLNSAYLDEIFSKSQMILQLWRDANVGTSNNQQGFHAPGGLLEMGESKVGEFGPEIIRTEPNTKPRVVPSHLVDPWNATVITNQNNGKSNTGSPVYLTVKLGNETLGKFVVSSVNKEINV